MNYLSGHNMMKGESEKNEVDADPGQARVPDDTLLIVDEEDDDGDDPNAGLLGRKSTRRSRGKGHIDFDPISSSWSDQQNPREWQRPYWLGGSLCLILFAFWMLDSLKDPIFGDLVNGNLKRHQPIAKLVSVATTLALVLFLEFLSNARKERQRQQESQLQRSNESILEGGGTWTKMGFRDDEDPPETLNNNAESSSLVHILVSYAVAFALISRILQYHPKEVVKEGDDEGGLTPWHFVGYFVYATIESFGSLAVASFWSFTNTTLSLEDAQKFYGTIVAIAQLGAVGGSTMATRRYTDTTLLLLSCLTILMHLVVMTLYTRRFRPTNIQAIVANNEDLSEVVEPYAIDNNRRQSIQSIISAATTNNDESNALWSGVHLILRHNYVLLLLGVSCLYEVSLTCLDYQMKLIGYKRFENVDINDDQGLTFTGFMGHFGQLVNMTSLILSLFGFPFMIRRFGLRYTLRLFPTLLVIATIVAFTALPGNLAVLFISMSLLKAMTYSIHDPSKELLYLPTSNTIKFKAKFWIDIVGARVAKAIGSTINTYAGSVDRSVSVGSFPSLLTAVLLWVACYCAGNDFDHLIETGTIVGIGDSDVPPKRFTTNTTDDDDIHSGIYFDDGGADGGRGVAVDQEDEADFVSSNSPDKAAADSTIELKELSSAMTRFKDPRIRRVSV